MNSEVYQSLSLRTVPANLMFWEAGSDADAREKLFCNCALGLAGEAAEIEEAPTSDEIGDGYWYSYVMYRVLDAAPVHPEPGQDADPHRSAYRSASSICELAKKVMFHGRPLDDVRDKALANLNAYVQAIAVIDPQSAAETFDQNVEKLKARYPAGFFERG